MEKKETPHYCVFIFLVSNIGGCLTPIGDPPADGLYESVPFSGV
ncbi:MAG: sodium:proton antiporter [Eisenbergiella sp.]